MLHAIKFKTVLTYPPAASFPRSLSSNLGRETSSLRFCTKPDTDSAHNMDKAQKPSEETFHGDVMSHSFGEGYATRSDEEGFGGTYDQYADLNAQKDKSIHENHPAYDKTQGSEVKEKENSRHQTSRNA